MHRVVVHNGLVFVGGTVADDVSAGLEGQTEQILAKFDEYLMTAGTDKTSLLSATIFLTDLGVKSMRLLTNNPRKFVGLQGYGLSISEAVPLEIPASESTRKYLKTKKDKLGHKLSSV